MTGSEIEKLNQILTLLIDGYSENARQITDLQRRTAGEQVVSPLASKESALRQAHQELYKALKGEI